MSKAKGMFSWKSKPKEASQPENCPSSESQPENHKGQKEDGYWSRTKGFFSKGIKKVKGSVN